MKVVTLLSGGLDSTALLYWIAATSSANTKRAITALSFDYGQRHGTRELEAAVNIVRHFQTTYPEILLDYHVIDLRSMTSLLEGSALTDRAVDVPDGHYTDERMRATVVPNRNMVMLSIATSVAVAQGAGFVAFGAHAGDHAIYPDCRRAFVEQFEQTARAANDGFIDPLFSLTTPFLSASKANIVTWGAHTHAPLELTWSCYKGGQVQCGTCATCIERREAFELAHVADPTTYLDQRPWREAVA